VLIGRVAQIWRYPVKSMAGEPLESSFIGPGGVAGDRGWALRDDTAGEIRSARRWPILLQCSARYRKEPEGAVPHVDLTLPDDTTTSSDHPGVDSRLSTLLGAPASLWPLQPATHEAHYRRARRGAAVAALIGRSRLGRRSLQTILRAAGLDGGVRRAFGREPGEPLPDFADLPAELFEFVSPPGTYFDVSPIHLLTTSSLAAMSCANPAADWDVRRFRPNILIDTGRAPALVEPGWCGRRVRVGRVSLRCEIPAPRCAMPTYPQRALRGDASMLRTIVRDGHQQLGVYANVVSAGQIAIDDLVESE
jgi:uncharacterized protein YcbX